MCDELDMARPTLGQPFCYFSPEPEEDQVNAKSITRKGWSFGLGLTVGRGRTIGGGPTVREMALRSRRLSTLVLRGSILYSYWYFVTPSLPEIFPQRKN